MHILPLNIGDFSQATERFKPVHIGIFMRLLFEYYKTENALCDEAADLEFVAGVETKSEREALALVLRRCFVHDPARKVWIQRRCERELESYRVSGIQKRYAILCRFWDSVNPGLKKPSLEQFTANVPVYYDERTRRIRHLHGKHTLELQAYSECDSTLPQVNYDTETRNQKPVNSNQNTPIVPKGTDTTGLPDLEKLAEAIYAIYPKKVGKTAALKAIVKVLKLPGGPTELELQATVKAYRDAVAKWDEQDKTFVPHPATWFNQGRYADDPATWIRESDSSRQNAGQKKERGGAAPLLFDDAPVASSEPPGWRERWSEFFKGQCPEEWQDVPLGCRPQFAQKNERGARR
jgi:hypothetical protein